MVRAGSVVFFLPFVLVPGATAAPPTVFLELPPLVDDLAPGAPGTIDARLVLSVPPDSDCDQPLPFRVEVAQVTTGLAAALEPGDGAFPAADLRPGQTITRGVQIVLSANETVPAYSDYWIRLRAEVPACGNLNATQGSGQTGGTIGFRPLVDLALEKEATDAWVVRATNRGNAVARLDWSASQTDAGRVVDFGNVTVAGLDAPAASHDVLLTVRKLNFDSSAGVDLSLVVRYAGNRTVDESPSGVANLRLHEPETPPSVWAKNQGVLLVAAFVLAAFALAGWAWRVSLGPRREEVPPEEPGWPPGGLVPAPARRGAPRKRKRPSPGRGATRRGRSAPRPARDPARGRAKRGRRRRG